MTAFFDTVYRVFMFVLPFGLCLLAYYIVGRRAWRAPRGVARWVALALVAGGGAYTLYRAAVTAARLMRNDQFEFAIIIVTVFVLFFASVALALAEPEKNAS